MRTGREIDCPRRGLMARIVVAGFTVLVPLAALSGQTSKRQRLSVAGEAFTAPTIYAADCTTPKTTFNLGETVCAKGSGLIGLRFQWVDPSGFAVAVSSIITDPQTTMLQLPSTDQSIVGGLFTANNLGPWRLNAVTLRNSATTSTFFTVRDPNNPRADLGIVKSLIGSTIPAAGDQVQFFVTITNSGPDDAINTHFDDNSFSNAVFNSIAQTSGPAFTCSGTDCHIAVFPRGAVATFTANFTAGGGGGVLKNSATVSSDTPDLNPKDNSTGTQSINVGSTGPPPACDLSVTAPPSVTLGTGPGATSCSVTVANLDATLGTPSVTNSCPLAGTVTLSGVPTGNIFPLGVTILTYTVQDTSNDTASAIQQVTVVDNTPPVISCPANLTLEPSCPSGAIATWTAPVGTDNCPGATTVQSAGPSSGSVFPIGTTTVSYTVKDASGNSVSCSFTVTVLTPAATIQNLEASVTTSSLTGPQRQGLLPKLDAALDAVTRGNIKAACGTLNAFVNQVQDYVSRGQVSAAQGQAWIASATHVANTIGCTNNPCT